MDKFSHTADPTGHGRRRDDLVNIDIIDEYAEDMELDRLEY
jgi:hypothetical protein